MTAWPDRVRFANPQRDGPVPAGAAIHAALDALAPKRTRSCPTSTDGLAPLNKNPCTSLQPSARSQSCCSAVSTPFRCRRDVEAPVEARDRPHDGAAIRAFGQILHKGAINLDLVEGKATQVAEARIARSKIIQRYGNAKLAELVQDRKICLRLRQKHRFGDFKLDPRRAVALNSISYNVARSVGPAIGGIVVVTAVAVASFALNTLLYIALLAALFLWKRVSEPSHLPPERLSRAIDSGVRYIINSPSIKIVLLRSMIMGVIGGGIIALMPLVARDLLQGIAQIYGIILSAFGLGAVVGALNITTIRKRMSAESAIRACALSMSGAITAVALSDAPVLTAVAPFLAGAVWMIAWAIFNIGVQLSAPRWVAGRSLAAYQAAGSGGIAVGSWGWGYLADVTGVQTALLISACLMLASPVLGVWLRMPRISAREQDAEMLADPEVRLELSGRNGPLVVEIEYRVEQGNARAFHKVMQDVSYSGSATARIVGLSRETLRTQNCGLNAITTRRGWITCDSAIAQRSQSATWIDRPPDSTKVPCRSASAGCWNAPSSRSAGKKMNSIAR